MVAVKSHSRGKRERERRRSGGVEDVLKRNAEDDHVVNKMNIMFPPRSDSIYYNIYISIFSLSSHLITDGPLTSLTDLQHPEVK